MAAPEYHNTLLRGFDSELIKRLDLVAVRFEVGQEIEFPGKPIRHLVFLEQGMASMTTTFRSGAQVEVTMFGYESLIGVSALMGVLQSLNRVYTQIPGWGYRCSLETCKAEFLLGGTFQKLALRYVQAQLLQSMQSTGCNAQHNLKQRLARWLLLCADRTHSDRFELSQEFLSHMLGASRPTITHAATLLKRRGLIEYRRGEIQILDRTGLEKQSCECYQAIRTYLQDYAAFDTKHMA